MNRWTLKVLPLLVALLHLGSASESESPQEVCPDPTNDCPDLDCPAGLKVHPTLGCEICKCKVDCPELGAGCTTDAKSCPYGLRVDTRGCPVCDCLPTDCARRPPRGCDETCDRVTYDVRTRRCVAADEATCCEDAPNNYNSQDDCVVACMACPPLDCALDCVLQKDADGCDQCKCQ